MTHARTLDTYPDGWADVEADQRADALVMGAASPLAARTNLEVLCEDDTWRRVEHLAGERRFSRHHGCYVTCFYAHTQTGVVPLTEAMRHDPMYLRPITQTT